MPQTTASHAVQQPASQPASSPPHPKRVKVTLACVVCRKKKVKCDGVQPSCSRCNNMGLACEYSDPPRKRGPPKGYVEVIENRAHRIESLLGKDNGVPSARWDSHVRPVAHPTATEASMSTNTSATATAAVPSLTTNTNASDAANARPRVNTLVDLISYSVQHDLIGSPGSHELCAFSDPDESEWAESFFSHFNLFFPILSRQHYLHQLQHSPQDMDPLLRTAVMLLGRRYHSGGNAADHQQQAWNKMYLRCSDQLLNEMPRLSTVQALAIICWCAYLTGDVQRSDTLREHLVKLVQSLHLCRSPDTSLVGIVQTELHQRAFWVVYVMDKWLALCTGRALLHRASHWDCKCPQFEDSQLHAIDRKRLQAYKEKTTHFAVDYALQVTAFADMIKLAIIVDEFVSQKTSAEMSIQALTSWLLNLPSYLEYSKPTGDSPPSPITRIYHMLYYTVQIFLYQQSTANGLGSSICTTAATTIVHIAEQMMQHHQDRYLCNTFLVSLTTAAALHLENAARCDPSAKLHLQQSLRVLQNANCTLLSRSRFDALFDHLVAKHGISLVEERVHELKTKRHVLPPVKSEVDIHELLTLAGITDMAHVDWLNDSAAFNSIVDPAPSFGSQPSPGSSDSYSPTLSCNLVSPSQLEGDSPPFHDLYSFAFSQQHFLVDNDFSFISQ